jgi:hypothetical protein
MCAGTAATLHSRTKLKSAPSTSAKKPRNSISQREGVNLFLSCLIFAPVHVRKSREIQPYRGQVCKFLFVLFFIFAPSKSAKMPRNSTS